MFEPGFSAYVVEIPGLSEHLGPFEWRKAVEDFTDGQFDLPCELCNSIRCQRFVVCSIAAPANASEPLRQVMQPINSNGMSAKATGQRICSI